MKPNPQQKKNQPGKQTKAAKAEKNKRPFYIGALVVILLVSLIAYLPALKNSFLWDDDDYIKNNLMIRAFNMKEIFSTYQMGNYHPLTMFVYAIEFKFFGLSEKGYHFVNILIHLLNTLLVFFVTLRLSKKPLAAIIATLLFGIHPMHVESIAWASELKDLMYTFFFLISYLYYLKFTDDGNKKFYVYAIVFFLCSLLSKAMAASLPLLLVLTDYFKGIKISKSIINKIPFFILSVIFGLVAIQAQKSSGAVDTASFSFPQRIVFASYGYIMYLVKLIVPFDLCAYYGYPVKSGGSVPGSFYAYLLAAIALAGLVIYSARKSKLLLFGFGFFTVTVLLVLQLLPVGWAIMADRYSYIPSIGIFYLIGEGFYRLWNNRYSGKSYAVPAAVVIGIASIFYTVTTNARCTVWKDGWTLWNDVIDKYQTIPQAYINRGLIYHSQNKIDEALADFNKAISLEPDFSKGYSNRAIIYTDQNKFDLAIADYQKTLQLDPKNFKAINNRGILYKKNNKLPEALESFNEAIRLSPTYVDAFHNRGVTYYMLGQFDNAINDFNRVIGWQPNYFRSFLFRGLAEHASGKTAEGCRDMLTASNMGYAQATEKYNQLCK